MNRLDLTGSQEKRDAAVVIAAHDSTVKQIRSEIRLSPEGKAAHLAANYLNARGRLNALRAKETGAVEDRRAALQRQLYGVASDPATLTSFRDAQDRAVALASPTEAQAALDRAAITGDHLAAKAIAMTAADKGWTDIVTRYAADTPGAQDTLDELRQLNASDPRVARIAGDMAYRLGMPAELKHYRNNLPALAAEAPAAVIQGNAPARAGTATTMGYSFLSGTNTA